MQQMNQEQGHIVYLKHFNQGKYLRGTSEQIERKSQGFIFANYYQEKDRCYVVLDNQPDQWFLRTKHKHSSQLRYGDEFTLQHRSSGRYLSSFASEKSETTEQGLMCLTNNEQWFFMQTSNLQTLQIHDKSYVRIFDSADRQTLHSHYNKYKFHKVKNYNEVTAFKERDSNDFWCFNIEILNPLGMDIEFKLIKSGDRVLLRNIHDLEYLQTVGKFIQLVKNYSAGAKQMSFKFTFDDLNKVYIQLVNTQQYIDIDQSDIIRLSATKLNPFQIIPIKSKELLLGQFFYISIHEKYLSRGDDSNLQLNEFPNVLSIWVIDQVN